MEGLAGWLAAVQAAGWPGVLAGAGCDCSYDEKGSSKGKHQGS